MKIHSHKTSADLTCGLLLLKRNTLRVPVFIFISLFPMSLAFAQQQLLFSFQNKSEAATKTSALLQAVKEHNIGKVQALLGRGVRVNGADVQGRTPLMWAALRANIPLCRLLLLYGANLNQRDVQGYTALALSIDEGGLYWMTSNPSTSTISETDYVATAKWLVLHGASLQLAGTSWDNLLDLTQHRLRGWIPMCTFLLQHGATIHGGKSGRSAILEAAVYAHSEALISLILKRHPTQQEKDAGLQTALGQRRYRLSSAETLQCIRLLLEAKSDPNVEDEEGYSALHVAIYAEDVELARLLIAHGADVNVTHQPDRFTPLATAKWRNNTTLQELLQHNGAKQ